MFQKMELRPISAFTKDYLEKLGGWPLIAGDSWKEEKFTWYDALFSFLRTLGMMNCCQGKIGPMVYEVWP